MRFQLLFQFFSGTDLKTRISSRKYQQIWFSGVSCKFSRKFDSELKPQYDRQTVRIYVTLENREFDSGGSSSQCSHSAPSNTSQHGKWRKTASVYAQMRMIDPFTSKLRSSTWPCTWDWVWLISSVAIHDISKRFWKIHFFRFFLQFQVVLQFFLVLSVFFSVFQCFSLFFSIFHHFQPIV